MIKACCSKYLIIKEYTLCICADTWTYDGYIMTTNVVDKSISCVVGRKNN